MFDNSIEIPIGHKEKIIKLTCICFNLIVASKFIEKS